MALEPYDPCPCGNGKKFKFCCQPIIEDLQALERLLYDRQPKQALLAAEKLEPLHSKNPLVLRYKTMAMMMLDRLDEAHELIHQTQAAHPQDPYGYFFDIRWHLQTGPWEQVRPMVERHLFYIGEQAPRLGYELAMEIVEVLLSYGCYMAVWRYLYDALAWARTQEEAKSVMQSFAELNKANDIPLPFRHMYRLKALPENQPNQTEFIEAMRFADALNWTKAGQLFEALSEKDPHQPVLTYNAGLCFAWSGDLAAAAELFGRAADDMPDFESAVDLETLAQLHEQMLPEEQIPVDIYRYKTKSVGRLLSQLDQEPRLYRQTLPPNRSETERPMAANYLLLDHPRNEGDATDVTKVSVALAALVVLDEIRDLEVPGEFFFRSLSRDFTDADRELILRAAGEQIDLTPEEGWGKVESEDGIPRDVAGLNFNIVAPANLKRSEVLKLMNAYSRHVVNEQWPHLPLSSLDDLTPAAAAQDPELHLPVCAAINVLASVAEQVNYAVDVDDLRSRLNLPPIEKLTAPNMEEFKQGNLLECLRLSYMEVQPEVLLDAFMALARTRAIYPLRRLLEALYVRGVVVPEFDTASVCRMASGLAIRVQDLDDAQIWNDRGREASLKAGADLMTRLEWDMNQLELCALTGNEDKLIEILRKSAREYFLKVPECKQQIQQLLTLERIDNPQIQAIMAGADLQTVGAGAGSGVWTPGSGSDAPAGKLWMPGQE